MLGQGFSIMKVINSQKYLSVNISLLSLRPASQKSEFFKRRFLRKKAENIW